MPVPATRSLSELLPRGAEGGKQFARVIDLLVFHDTRRQGGTALLLNDAAGDYEGLDSVATLDSGRIGFQYKFFPSPLSSPHRSEIAKSLEHSYAGQENSQIIKWIIVTPDDLVESSTRRDGGDVRWFEKLRADYRDRLEIEHWGHTKLQALFIETPSIALFYYPELIARGQERIRTLRETQDQYVANMLSAYGKIQFVGMSVYKPEATKGIEMQDIYIPLALVNENTDDEVDSTERTNPITLLEPRSRAVILGDPGSGKSTLLKFLALGPKSPNLQAKYNLIEDRYRLPVLVTLRRYADELKTRSQLPLLDYLVEVTNADFSLRSADIAFFEAFLDSGRAVLCFDGLDELPNSTFKEKVRDRISSLMQTYPGNTCLITSRIVGYDSSFRFDDRKFAHWKIAQLQLPEIEQFVTEWYAVREESPKERDDNVAALVRVIRDPDHEAIRALAGNPLLLTIIALVHRIDAVLPDERVVLYQKCTETLLNTWHTWKFRDSEDQASRTKVERRNKRRIETIAHWMQQRSVGRQQRAVVSYEDLKQFVSAHVHENERMVEGEPDAGDVAEEFLEFVRKRAGLLIEVGDGQYSFVHLTFQEYLAAADIRTISEKGGAAVLWKNIRDTTDADRWQETTRLLVASLQSPDTRAYLVGQIIRQTDETCTVNRCLLLLGCVVDGIDEAEDRLLDILRLTLLAAVRCDEHDDLKRMTSRARKLSQRVPISEYGRAAAIAVKQHLNATEVSALPLALVAIGGSDECVLKENFAGSRKRHEAVWYDILIRSQPVFQDGRDRSVQGSLRSLLAAAARLASVSPEGNALAVVLSRVAFGFGFSAGFDFCARLLLSTLIARNGRTGPFQDAGMNILSIANYVVSGGLTPRGGQRRRELSKAGDILVETLLQSPTGPPRWFSPNRRGSLSFVDSYADRVEIRPLVDSTQLPIAVRSAFSDQTVELLAKVLRLRPQPIWAEAMAVRWQEGAGLANWDMMGHRHVHDFRDDSSFRTLIVALDVWHSSTRGYEVRELVGLASEFAKRAPETEVETFGFAVRECVKIAAEGRRPDEAVYNLGRLPGRL